MTVTLTIGPFKWLFSSSTFFLQKGQRSKVIQQKIEGEFFRLVSSTTKKNQTANGVGYNDENSHSNGPTVSVSCSDTTEMNKDQWQCQ